MKSPLKDKPLRTPGESLDKEIIDLIFDGVILYFLMSLLFVMMAMMEWIHWYSKAPPSPWLYSFMALVAVLYSTVKIIRVKKKLKSLRQGRDGEKAVGQYLELLREKGAKIYHDIPAKGFNLDHVVICKSGIYVIETKTFSKPDKGEAKIIFNGEAIFLNGKIENNKPIVQVKAAANWLKDLINDSTGHKFIIKPVVVFPGWYIESTSEAKSSEVWVLNPRVLPAFIGNSKEHLSAEEISMVAFHLSRYVRSYVEAA